ncbi:hypothetical protein MAA_11148 [Metarhizium robertsii ARSEF 23]|uniref:Uncharacterized protein n=1 Tax=Metarhizium robertsii (strain ARSEF 23 / ATCC MYA-3075) TaxID=655844 RepID=A0A0B2X8W2_METRA|nr:uncharacterized protein MAA_11148 [Metarhizium robertsii ARSEF 23]KHO11333.1 hypothetical protein MAA_11148 [Metarhizium robertsii ARSEF 23]
MNYLTLSAAIIGDKEKKAAQLQQLFDEQASKAATQLNTLLVDGKQLESDFSVLAYHLLNTRDLAEPEKSQLSEDEVLLSMVWGLVNPASCRLISLKHSGLRS